MSAACSHVRAPLSARKMTSCIFIARSTAAAAKTIGTSLGAYGCSPVRPQSGHFTCSRERTDHVLPTVKPPRLDRQEDAALCVRSRCAGPASRTVLVPRPRRCRMTTGIRCLPRRCAVGVFALLVAAVVVAAGATALAAAGTPRPGGVRLAVIGADPPSLDPHQESTFANIELVAPLYSTLLQIDPYDYPKIIGDVAADWKIAADGSSYTFKLRQGMRFHDGSPLTAADVKATYDKIVFPPPGVRSVRKNAYTAVASIEAPDPSTVVFRLKFPSASLFDNLASPGNVIFPKKYLDRDPNHFKTN